MSESPRQRKRRRHQPSRPPVLTVACPQCGGSVRDADLGDRTKCQYCGTNLHLPTVDFTPDSQREVHVAQPGPQRAEPPAVEVASPSDASGRTNSTQLLMIIGAGCFAAVALMMLLGRSAAAPYQTRGPASPAVKTDHDGVVENAECQIGCTQPCLEIHEPEAMLECMGKCDAKCKFVGKGTPAQCRARCATTCAPAPDAQSRASCENGCFAGCPR